MQYQPKVTIIIPVYNGSNFMAEAINSALAQTYPHCEVLVINDGSTDNGLSEQIALSYGDKIRYYHKENGGVSSVLNFAFTKMTGEWFSWLSHDDLYQPGKIEKQVAFINELMEQHPDLDIHKITVRCASEAINKNGNVIKKYADKHFPRYEKPINTILNNVKNYKLCGCAFLLPSSCVADVGGFAEDIRTVSDVEYWYRLLFAGYEFYCLTKDCLVQSRSHGKQVGKTKVSLFDKELTELFRWIADEMNRNPEMATVSNNERLYYGLTKRRCAQAANYVKTTYLKHRVGKLTYLVKYPLRALPYALLGRLRNMARYVYRRIYVK